MLFRSPEVWVHHYDLENNRVAPKNPEVVNFGRPSQDLAGAPSSSAPSSSTPAAPVIDNPTGAEPTLKTPVAPTPSRATTGDSQAQEELAKHMRSPRRTGFQTKKVATKPPVKPASATADQAKDKSPAKQGREGGDEGEGEEEGHLDGLGGLVFDGGAGGGAGLPDLHGRPPRRGGGGRPPPGPERGGAG